MDELVHREPCKTKEIIEKIIDKILHTLPRSQQKEKKTCLEEPETLARMHAAKNTILDASGVHALAEKGDLSIPLPARQTCFLTSMRPRDRIGVYILY